MSNIPINNRIDHLMGALKEAKKHLNKDIYISKDSMDTNIWWDHDKNCYKIRFALRDDDGIRKGVTLIIENNQLGEVKEGQCFPEHRVQLKDKTEPSKEEKTDASKRYEFL